MDHGKAIVRFRDPQGEKILLAVNCVEEDFSFTKKIFLLPMDKLFKDILSTCGSLRRKYFAVVIVPKNIK